MKLAAFFLALLLSVAAAAQQKIIDSLKQQLSQTGEDTNRVQLLNALVYNYYVFKPDSAIIMAQQAYDLSQNLRYQKGIALSLNRLAAGYMTLSDYSKSITLFDKALQVSQAINDSEGISRAYNNIGDSYVSQKDYNRALDYFTKAQAIKPAGLSVYLQVVLNLNIGSIYLELHRYDSAANYLRSTYARAQAGGFDDLYGELEGRLAMLEAGQHNNNTAIALFQKSIQSSIALYNVQYLSTTYSNFADFYQRQGQRDSAIAYAKKALEAAQQSSYNLGILEASQKLAGYLAATDPKAAYQYLLIGTAAKDSIFSQERIKQILSVSFEEGQRQREVEAARAESRNRFRLVLLLGTLGVLLLLAIILYRNNRTKQQANTLLQQQKGAIEKTLAELKATQAQLVQSEKMASLGELTAGIAHEIQNPLNFVNNFAEVNTELLAEMQTAVAAGDLEEVRALAGDLEHNERKIVENGKRADSIVKGMLQHSRVSKGETQPTDIAVLAEEYLRLAYHGLRAKDKTFNATLKTDFTPGINQVDIVPQDVGRVLLNLFNNAFYAVSEKRSHAGAGYEPTVCVATRRHGGFLDVVVQDNGMGISKSLMDKIFQPFFTTKPPGQGTGLGLSLSYDIIKAHNGELLVDSTEGSGTTFTVRLPQTFSNVHT